MWYLAAAVAAGALIAFVLAALVSLEDDGEELTPEELLEHLGPWGNVDVRK